MAEAPRVFENLPVMPLRDAIIFPKSIMPFFVGRQSSIHAIEAANAARGKQIFLVAQKDSLSENPDPGDLYGVGVVCKILQLLELPDGTVKILCEGLYRARWDDLRPYDSWLVASGQEIPDTGLDDPEGMALASAARESLETFGANNPRISQESLLSIMSFREPGELADAIAPQLKLDARKKQEILEISHVARRLEKVFESLETEKVLSEVEKRIKNRVKVQMERNQRDYYLMEQIKAINKEMGREDDPQAEALALEKRIEEKGLPAEAKAKALEEVRKLRIISPATAEYAVARNYIDWILDLPWNESKETNIDLRATRQLLDGEHYGLLKAKERILEYLAVQKLSNSLKGPILCLVGPPGVGKTSLAKSVAKATGRDFVRLSLGGVRDEAEIRGHRRTYVGAMPGKILQSLKRVHSNNPLFCLDEIDKIASDYRGDPASALLEALDPEQNTTFMDHYLDLDYDLSRIFFITTANSLHNIPAPLLDRMEIIEAPSYLETEKREIARNFLLPRRLVEHGLNKNNLHISEKAITDIIRDYTREAGVRNLDREIAAVCRKTAVKLVESEDPQKRININRQNLATYLGPPKYRYEKSETAPQIGVCAGLAYNQRGGDILFVETSVMNGSGHISTTGQLGEVMTESAQAALTYARSRAEKFGLDPDFYQKIDIHVHVPSGAIPKDGPSAGITLAASIISALLGIPARNDVAMTGEISLRGRALPIGGLREKLLAAHRGGIKKVIIPKANMEALKETPEEILKDIEIVAVDHIDDALPHILLPENGKIFKTERGV
ncbi:MAG: endopeptidase La [Desulfovibrio sp.]|nr:endopeptidase La [Desulfovibrio sp.]